MHKCRVHHACCGSDQVASFFGFVCGLMKLMCSLRVNEQCVMHTETGK